MRLGVRTRWYLWLIPACVLAATALVVELWSREAGSARERVFETLVTKMENQVRSDLVRYFDPVSRTVTTVRRWGEEGAIALTDPEALNVAFFPLLESLPSVSAAIVADDSGREYLIGRDGDAWQTRMTTVANGTSETVTRRWVNATTPMETWTRSGAYDPRTRPWFVGAMAEENDPTPFWTQPYEFFTAKRPGVTASVAWPARGGGTMVAAFDVLLDDVVHMLSRVTVADHGLAFLVTDDGKALGVATGEANGTAGPLVDIASMTRMPYVAAAYRAWRDAGQPQTPFPVTVPDFGTWWVTFQPYPLDRRTYWIGTAVPESDLLARVGGEHYVVPAAVIALGGLAFAVSVSWVVRTRRRGLASRATAASGTSDVRALIAGGESAHVEFKSTVRWNLRAGKPGREMELAWLKTVVAYLNSDGGVILLGVDDDGKPLGLDHDGFANEDKCLRHIGNLVDQHVGTAFLPYVATEMTHIDGRPVVVIRCRPSPQPAFLRDGKDEAFYIRSGPASRQLPPSQIIGYMETRKAAAGES